MQAAARWRRRALRRCSGKKGGVCSSLPNTSLPSIHIHSQFSDYFLKCLDFHPSPNIFLPSRSGKGRVAIVIETRSGMRWPLRCRAWKLADYGLKPGSAVGQAIDADTTGGRSKCMPARQLARSGRGRRKRQFPVSDAASRKIHPRAERRRRSASEARFSSHARRRGAGPPPVCRESGIRAARINNCGRRGRGETPCRSARPSGAKEQE